MDNTQLFDAESLKTFADEVFQRADVNKEDAETIADVLIQANLEGLDSHGISKLPIYLKHILEGRINPRPSIKIERTAPGVILVDGDNGPGPVNEKRSIDSAIDIIGEVGIVACAVNNSNHYGVSSFGKNIFTSFFHSLQLKWGLIVQVSELLFL